MTNPFEGLGDEEDMEVVRRENQLRFLAETTPPLDEEEEVAVVMERLRRIRHRLAEVRRRERKED